MCREKVFSAQPFKSGILEPQAIDKIEIRAKRGQRRRGASDEERKKIIGSKPFTLGRVEMNFRLMQEA